MLVEGRREEGLEKLIRPLGCYWALLESPRSVGTNSRAVIGLRAELLFQPALCVYFWTLETDRRRDEHQHRDAPISAFSRQEVERQMSSQEKKNALEMTPPYVCVTLKRVCSSSACVFRVHCPVCFSVPEFQSAAESLLVEEKSALT